MNKLVLSVLSVIFLNTSCMTEYKYQEGDYICYDLCLQKGLYVKVDTEEKCECADKSEYLVKGNE